MAAFIHPLTEHLQEFPEVQQAHSYQAHMETIREGYSQLWNRYMASWAEEGSGGVGDELL